MLILCGTQDSRKTLTRLKLFRDVQPNWYPVFETCHIKNDCKPWIYRLWCIVDIVETWLKYINLYMEFTSLDRVYYLWHLRLHWEDICSSWRKDIVTHSWDPVSFHSKSSICGTVYQVMWCQLRQWMLSKKGWTSTGRITVIHWIWKTFREDTGNKWSAKRPLWPNHQRLKTKVKVIIKFPDFSR